MLAQTAGPTVSRTQCAKCPWKVTTNPHDIPDGYCETKHRNLKATIATPGSVELEGPLRVMACHESPVGKEQACVGWVHNQLGPGNNIPLRLRVMCSPEIADYKLVGKQHERFEDTLP